MKLTIEDFDCIFVDFTLDELRYKFEEYLQGMINEESSFFEMPEVLTKKNVTNWTAEDIFLAIDEICWDFFQGQMYMDLANQDLEIVGKPYTIRFKGMVLYTIRCENCIRIVNEKFPD